ncbi:MAG: Crp/Fnr family transcriptional regulator [Johnsonella sp.]|nr:Crp/Fnr family transcriptional regulator [Johnsonella sp.]
MKDITDRLKKSAFFADMNEEQIKDCLRSAEASIVSYAKEDIIFHQHDEARHIMVLLEGSIAVCGDFANGKRRIVAVFDHPGELFGEVYLFLKNRPYEHYALALTSVKILRINKQFLYQKGEYQRILTMNMLSILSYKNYYLNTRVRVLSCSGLRQKLAHIFLHSMDEKGKVLLNMKREEFADWLNTARPSLSRELMKMQEEGLIKIIKKDIYVRDEEKLGAFL